MEFAKPREEHKFLERLVGEWIAISSSEQKDYDPDNPETRWTENVRSLGGIWFVAEGEGAMPGGSRATTIMTLGYDAKASGYIGTWVGSTMDKLWIYKGWVEADGNTLTLEAEGPSFDDPAKTAIYHDVITFIDDNRRTFSGSVKLPDGSFKTFMTSEFKRA